MNIMLWIWLGTAVVFGVVEAATAGLVSIWFVGGAVAALVATMFQANIWVQLGAFLLVSALLLAATRPFVKKMNKHGTVATNADRVLGQSGRVCETIDRLAGTGAVYVDGKTWSARSNDESLVIPEGETVTILRMEGVKLFVEPVREPARV